MGVLMLTIAYSVILGCLFILGGQYMLFYGGIVLVAMLFAAIQTSHQKTKEDLARIEKKLDQLLEQQKEN